MAAVTIAKLKITPYTQKDAIAKIVYGDEWGITVRMPTPHQAGDTYAIGIDYENLLYPPGRPLCAGTDDSMVDGDNLSFSLKLGTARLRDWCSSLKKPTPIYVQIVRTRGETLETLLLDTLLALPSVFDGAITVYPGDPIQDLLDEKLDKPEEEGRPGQYLALGPDGETIWKAGGGGGGGVQADWDESDSDSPAYIRNKPEIPSPVKVTASTAASLSLANADEVVDWSPVGDCTLASVALPAAGIVQSWELRLALASDATLTLGEGIAFAVDAEGTQDAVTGGAVNILLVRATSAGAVVYVCGTEASA